ncbi:50S ribosomal protein L7ae [Candidatus Woesearchaeota archaeon]|nr:50S ribosomal protein L7ae [Candidatus Woesearchaeota archaeon]
MNKDVEELAFEAVELAKKSGKIKKGANEVTKIVEKGAAKLVVYAKDVNPSEIVMHLKPLCQKKQVPVVEVSKREELGVAAGLKVPTSAVVVVQEGDAKDAIQKLAAQLKA